MMSLQLKILLFSYLYFLSVNALSQCGSLVLDIKNEICQEEILQITNNSVGIASFSWDYCPGDMKNFPSANIIDNLSDISRPHGLDIIKEGSKYYGFLISRITGKLFRLDFGASLNNIPIHHDLGIVVQSEDISLVKDISGVWHGYAATGDSKIYRIDFDSGIGEAISYVNLGNFGGIISAPRAIRTQKKGDDIYVFATSSNLNTLSIIKFTGGVTGLATSRSIDITGGSQIIGLDIIKECNLNYAVVSAVSNRKLYRVSLGNDLMDNLQTSIEEITNLFGIRTYELDIVIENNNYHILLPTFSGPLIQADFGASITNIPTINDLGNFGILDKTLGAEFINDSSTVTGFLYNYITSDLFKISYPNNCSANIKYSEQKTPTGVTYKTSGKKYIEIKGYDNLGNSTNTLVSITILGLPNTNFTFSNACFGQNTKFFDNSSSLDGIVNDWSWDFAGIGTSTLQNPTFDFPSAGSYDVSLTSNDQKGCSNTLTTLVKIYRPNDIVPAFSYPIIICTNTDIAFMDKSIYEEDQIVDWFWSFNGDGSSVEQNPLFTFKTAGIKNTTLTVTGLSGCSYSITQQLDIQDGPTTAFSFDNVCNTQATTFTDLTTGANLTNWNWDFGDDLSSTDHSPAHTYLAPGQYEVTLSVSNATGCTTQLTQTVFNHSVPEASFTHDLLCSTSPIQFTNQSMVEDANLVAWEWVFGDATTSTEQNPQHSFGQKGDYQVKLKAYSQFGCIDSAEKLLSIAQGPQVDFEWDKSCEGEATTFADLTNSFSNRITNWTWIVNGTLFTTQNPVYTFAAAGTYAIQLSVTIDNLCAQTITQDIIIEAPLQVQFDYTEGCETTNTTFYDLTIQNEDPIIAREWRVDGILFSTDSKASPDFEPGSYAITLSVITAGGCEETTTSNVTIIGSPVASFDVNTTFGAAPLQVLFENTSTGSSTYEWFFDDSGKGSSTISNPEYTFTEIGIYAVKLTTSSVAGCSNEATKIIEVVAPETSGLITAINTIESADKTNFILTIENTGTSVLNQNTNLVFRTDYGTEIIEALNETIYAGKIINYQPVFAVASIASVNNLCVELKETSQLDRACISINTDMVISEPYPNPSFDLINVDIMIKNASIIDIRMINRDGKVVFTNSAQGLIGLNQLQIDTHSFIQGIYVIEVSANGKTEQFKASVMR